jgi:kumamolisin
VAAGLAKLLEKAFVLGYVLPAIAFLSALIALFGCPASVCDATKPDTNPFAELTYAALAVYFVAVVLLVLNYGLYRFFEGYLPPLSWFGSLTAFHQARQQHCIDVIAALSQGDPRGNVLAWQLRKEYPPSSADVLPTAFGNAVRAFEVYPAEAYGVDSISAWPRLLTVISNDYQSLINDAKSTVDLAINLSALAFLVYLYSIAVVMVEHVSTEVHIAPPHAGGTWSRVAFFGLVVALVSYRAAISLVPTWGDQIKSAFDCYLPQLAKQMGYSMPQASKARRKIWLGLSGQLLYGESFDPPFSKDANGKDTSVATYAALAGSERKQPVGSTDLGPADENERTTVTVVLHPPDGTDPAAAQVIARLSDRTYLSRAELAAQRGATPEAMLAVERFAIEANLVILAADAARRSVVLEGTIGQLTAAFRVDLRRFQNATGTFRGRTGTIQIPTELHGTVSGVFGLDERPQARTQFRIVHPRAVQTSYTPLQLGELYAFPAGTDGTGQTIALIELGGGYTASDLSTYFTSLGIAEPTVTSVSVDGGTNAPTGDPNSADGEVDLDIEVAGALAPKAQIVVYFAPNTDQGFLDAITTAVHDTANHPDIISISWGSAESEWTQQAMTNFDAAFADAAMAGVTVCVAAGDGGSADGETDGKAHVDFPASSPHALGCGGTTLNANGTTIASETVWNDPSDGATGGGISDVFPLPSWQSNAKVPPSSNAGAHIGRGVPDVAGNADPATGYAVRIDGTNTVLGGTSAVAPLWSALIARLNQRTAKPLGLINPLLYANPTALHDITSGSNGAYKATTGWDPCTGLGTPNGTTLQTLK